MRHRTQNEYYIAGNHVHRPHKGGPNSCLSQRTVSVILGILLLILVLRSVTASIVEPLRTYLEKIEVRPDSTTQMMYFYVASQLLFIPSPIPFVITFYVLAIGYFFKMRGFLLLAVSFGSGILLSFKTGQALKRMGLNARKHLKTNGFHKVLEQFNSVGSVIKKNPSRMCFLLMWTPLPTQLLPFLVGLLTEVETRDFMLGAVPSKLLHFSCPLLIGLEASSLSSALNGESATWSSAIILMIPVALTIVLMVAMGYYIKTALKNIKSGDMAEEHLICEKLIV